MTTHYNISSQKEKRRQLRQNQTYCEKIVWENVRNRRLLGLKFRRQYSVDKFVIDFYCPELKLALEIDGEYHSEPEQIEYDKERQKYLESFGIEFLRITNDELLGNPNKAFKRVKEKIKQKQIKL